ncbi:hypothetical protein MTR67_047536 [Solanum verrucosum]|uniref:Histone chaperone domain-containing protein n=1 Tax=Solanum verrucosum TaxID=315347 RepID=A0AAF0ZWL1_SOLVR|nr:hypothetical protein MTR67_047536 [Solanum verrucosum]
MFYLRSITLAGVRRLLEEDLGLEKNTLDAFKKFIQIQIDEVLTPSEAPKSSSVKKSPEKKSKTAKKSGENSNSFSSQRKHIAEKVKSRKSSAAKETVEKSEGLKKRKKPNSEDNVPAKKQKEVSKNLSDENSDGDTDKSDSEDGQSGSSAEIISAKKKVVKGTSANTGYGKRVEHLKSIFKACGMSVAPSIYKRAKQVSDDKREGFLIKELEKILSAEGLSTNPTEKDIMGILQHSHQHQMFEKNLNATFVALIPKKNGTAELGDFRPLSLMAQLSFVIQMQDKSALQSGSCSTYSWELVVVDKFDKLRRYFLWNGVKEDKGFRLVRWDVVQLEKKVKGSWETRSRYPLGVHRVKLRSYSIARKPHRRDRALWKEVIMENMDSRVNSALVKQSALIVYQFGGLSETYGLTLMSMLSTINLEASVADPWTPQGWNICFRRNLDDREIDRVVGLMKEVDKFKGTSTVTDAISWKQAVMEEIKEVKKRKQTAKELEGIDLSNIVSNTRRRSTTSFVAPPRPKSPPKSDKNDDKDGDSDADDASDDDKDDDDNEDDESNQSDEEFNEGGDNLHVCAGSSALKGFLA